MQFLQILYEAQGIIQFIYILFCLAIIYRTATVATSQMHEGSSSSMFLAMSCIFFLLLQLPIIALNEPLNPDEAQMTANANKFLTNMNTWNSVDTTTSGPLNSYVLMWPALFGGKASIAVARITRSIVLITAWILLFWTNHKTFLPIRIFIAAALMVFLASTRSRDFLQYSSEMLSVLLIASSVLLTFQMIECKPEWKTAFISGLLLGCIPFAKLQATPIGFAIGITQIGLLLGKGWIRIRPVVALIIGASCPAALILLPLARTEGLADFWISYVRWGMMEYARPFTWTSFVLLVDIMRRPETMAYLLSMMLLTAVGFIYWMPRYKLWTRDAILKLIFSTLLLMVSVYCVVRPGFSFAHYSFFLLWPIATLAGSVLLAPNSGHISKGGILIGIIVASLLLASGAGFWETKLNPLERFAFPLRSWKLPGLLEVAGIEDIFASGNLLSIDNAPGQRVFVWGWMAQYYLYANLTPAVRDIINHKQIDEGSLTSYFQERLISDLMHDPPDYVVDAVANRSFRYSNSVTEGLSSIPKIHKFIREEYTLMSDSTNGVDCSKIYARNSIAKIHRARYARVGNLQVSSQLDSSYSPSQLIDGVLFDTCQRAWLLPNRTQGTLTFNLVSPQEVRTLELLNTRNWPQFNRASRRVRIEASQRGQRIFEQEVIMRRYPYWTEVPFPSGLGEIDSITVNIIDFLGIGGGLTQVRVRTSD